MKLINCLNPKMVYNRYTKERVFVRCGKCEACRNARAANWVDRLDIETSLHPFTMFVTLTYDDCHLMQFVRLRPEDCDVDDICYIDSLSGSIISLYDSSCYPITNKDVEFCKNTKVLNVINKSDFQLFIKRLRKYVTKHYKSNFRYFVTFEYGPSTLRSHAHSLFFLDSPLLAENFANLLLKYWKFGTVFDPHYINSSASSYVAQYVNSYYSLPAIFRHKQIRQASLYSKRPPIACYKIRFEELRKLFFTSALTYRFYRDGKFCDVPLWRSLQYRLYPAVSGFNQLDVIDRITLYRLSERYERCPQIGFYALASRHSFFFATSKWSKYAFNCLRSDSLYASDGKPFYDSLRRFYSCIMRVLHNARAFGISVSQYVVIMSEWYDKKQKSDFREFLLMQDDYFKSNPISDFLKFNPAFVLAVNGRDVSTLLPWEKFYLSEYDSLPDSGVVNIDLRHSFAYFNLSALHKKIFFDNTKSKYDKDYLMANKDKFNNVLTFYNS